MAEVYLLTGYGLMEEQDGRELPAARAVLGDTHVGELIHDVPVGSTVIPRFRALPFGDLIEQEVRAHGSSLVNTYRQHRAIADSSSWAHLLDGSDGLTALSPRQYDLADIPNLPEGEWFVKGETNSLKNRWIEASYAPTTGDLTRVTGAFLSDAWLGSQRVVIKPFQRYRRLATALNHQPIFHERRVFVLDSQVLSDGFYWTPWTDEVGVINYDRVQYLETLQSAIERVGHLARFIVIDLAEYEEGFWGVVELNDGAMSGLSENDPTELWSNFIRVSNGGESHWNPGV